MLANLQNFFTFEMIYLFANFGVMPFWLILIFIPNSRTNQILVNSIIAPALLCIAYTYAAYQLFLIEDPILNNFKLYIGLDNLYVLFAEESVLLIFWLHFLTLSLFLGSWISRDGVKYNIPKIIVGFTLIITYFSGPLGLILYWVIRLFFSRKLGFHD